MDDAETVLNGALENHYKMINEFKVRTSKYIFLLNLMSLRFMKLAQ